MIRSRRVSRGCAVLAAVVAAWVALSWAGLVFMGAAHSEAARSWPRMLALIAAGVVASFGPALGLVALLSAPQLRRRTLVVGALAFVAGIAVVLAPAAYGSASAQILAAR